MQDKITIADAPDCLNTNDKAMWVLGYEAAIEARGQCLHQIQEPAPVLAAQPIAWPKNAQDARDFLRSDFITAQFAAEDQTPCDEDRYHISAHDFLSAVNWWADFPHIPRTPEAAPAAVAVPDDRAAFERELIDNHHYVPSDFSFKDGFYGGDDDYIQFGWDMWQARAALDATPAAVPVVLPEPDAAVSELMRLVEMASIQRASTAVLIYTGQPKELSDKSSAQEQETVRSIESKLRALLATATGLPAQAFQQRVHPWMMACFGPEISANSQERNHRFLEEALELVQSCGCTASEAHQLVDYVYGRPWGEPEQEAGGVMVTLAALCLANSLDMHACGETELARIWTKVEAIRAKQAAKPKHSPLPMQAPQTQDALRLAFVLSEIRRDGMDALSAALHDLDGFPLDHQASVEAIDRAAIAAAKGE